MHGSQVQVLLKPPVAKGAVDAFTRRVTQFAERAARRAGEIRDEAERIRVLTSNMKGLARFFWFTIEFGLMKDSKRGLAAYGSGLLADACKLFIARWRPKMIEDWSAGAETFVGWLPAFQAEGLPTAWGHALQSFPSGHAATGVGLAVGLSALYPRAWIWFAVLATLAAGQRIATGNHFLSDTLVGAAIGLFVAQRLCGDGPLSRWFSNWETTVSTAPDPESNAP